MAQTTMAVLSEVPLASFRSILATMLFCMRMVGLSQAVAGNDALLHIHCGLAAKRRQGRWQVPLAQKGMPHADHEHLVALVSEAVIASNKYVHCPC